MGFPPGAYEFSRGEGCGECFNTGYRGRIGAFEVLPVTPAMRRAIHARSLKELEQAVQASGFQPIMDNCRQLVLEGITSTEEIHRVLGG